jgi:hypothetical protein
VLRRCGRAGAWSLRAGRSGGAVTEGLVVASQWQGGAGEFEGTTGRALGKGGGLVGLTEVVSRRRGGEAAR